MTACAQRRLPSTLHIQLRYPTQVVIGVEGIASDGGIVAVAGAYSIALAAAAHGVPVIAVCNVLKVR